MTLINVTNFDDFAATVKSALRWRPLNGSACLSVVT
jgi:hypothetical protein